MFNKRNLAAGAFIASVANADTNGLFGVFDTDKNGTIEPTEVYDAYKQMDSKADNRLTRTEFMKTMDGHVRSFCGVHPATKQDLIKMDEEKKRLIAFTAPSLGAHMHQPNGQPMTEEQVRKQMAEMDKFVEDMNDEKKYPKEDEPEEDDYGLEDLSDEEMKKFEALAEEDLKRVQKELEAHNEEFKKFEKEAADFEKEMATWKGFGKGGEHEKEFDQWKNGKDKDGKPLIPEEKGDNQGDRNTAEQDLDDEEWEKEDNTDNNDADDQWEQEDDNMSNSDWEQSEIQDDDGRRLQRSEDGSRGGKGGRKGKGSCEDGSKPACSDGTVPNRESVKAARKAQKSPCADTEMPRCGDGTVFDFLKSRGGGKGKGKDGKGKRGKGGRKSRNKNKKACANGEKPICPDGSVKVKKTPCAEKAKPVCADGTVLERKQKKQRKSPCADGERPQCPDGSKKEKKKGCPQKALPVCADGTVIKRRSREERKKTTSAAAQNMVDLVSKWTGGGRRLRGVGGMSMRQGFKKAMKKFNKVKKMVKMMVQRRGIFTMLDSNSNRSISLKEMFRPFSNMDSNGNTSVTQAEFSTFMNKAKRPVCMFLKRQALKEHALSWQKMGQGI